MHLSLIIGLVIGIGAVLFITAILLGIVLGKIKV